ncbi:DUF5065 family protein [Bacillus thuringiensis]|jgi:hypothetical protein
MKLGKLALVGALALGGLTGLATLDAKPAAAATENVQKAAVSDNWPFKNIYELAAGTIALPDKWLNQFKPAYYTGDNITLTFNWVDGIGDNAVKIYRVLDDQQGTLARYQTIYPMKNFNGTDWSAVWTTKVTSVYENGTYIAVLELAGGDYYRSQTFTINR